MTVSCDVLVVGAGAAGLLAAARAAELGARVLLLEKNKKPGVKILMSGGTRCNITHSTDNRGIVAAYGHSGKVLHSPLASLSVADTLELFHELGVPTKVEETGKVFPVSNKATDVLAALLRRLTQSGAELVLGEALLDLQPQATGFSAHTSLRTISASRVILTTGGLSYPGSGTTGDGYRLAAKLGHTVTALRPALVPIRVQPTWVAELRGITLPDVAVRVLEANKTLAQQRGSLLFAHFGLSGPAILDVSRAVSGHAQPSTLNLTVDLVPNISEPDLAEQLRLEATGKKLLAGVLSTWVPRRLAEELLALAQLPKERKAAGLAKPERNLLVQQLKNLTLPISGTLGFEKAEVTAGGVTLTEVDFRTMQSKRVPGLYLAGEVLDLDGPIGGYNFQAAWSTGWLAGTSAGGA